MANDKDFNEERLTFLVCGTSSSGDLNDFIREHPGGIPTHPSPSSPRFVFGGESALKDANDREQLKNTSLTSLTSPTSLTSQHLTQPHATQSNLHEGLTDLNSNSHSSTQQGKNEWIQSHAHRGHIAEIGDTTDTSGSTHPHHPTAQLHLTHQHTASPHTHSQDVARQSDSVEERATKTQVIVEWVGDRGGVSVDQVGQADVSAWFNFGFNAATFQEYIKKQVSLRQAHAPSPQSDPSLTTRQPHTSLTAHQSSNSLHPPNTSSRPHYTRDTTQSHFNSPHSPHSPTSTSQPRPAYAVSSYTHFTATPSQSHTLFNSSHSSQPLHSYPPQSPQYSVQPSHYSHAPSAQSQPQSQTHPQPFHLHPHSSHSQQPYRQQPHQV